MPPLNSRHGQQQNNMIDYVVCVVTLVTSIELVSKQKYITYDSYCPRQRLLLSSQSIECTLWYILTCPSRLLRTS
jgi:hypothetical protein